MEFPRPTFFQSEMPIWLSSHSAWLDAPQISSFRAASECIKTPFPPRGNNGPTPPSIATGLARGRGGVPSARRGAWSVIRAEAGLKRPRQGAWMGLRGLTAGGDVGGVGEALRLCAVNAVSEGGKAANS